MTDRDKTLAAAIAAFREEPPVFAKANNRGKFPMGQLRTSKDGASADIEPLTHACTAASFEKIGALVAAVVAWQNGQS